MDFFKCFTEKDKDFFVNKGYEFMFCKNEVYFFKNKEQEEANFSGKEVKFTNIIPM